MTNGHPVTSVVTTEGIHIFLRKDSIFLCNTEKKCNFVTQK